MTRRVHLLSSTADMGFTVQQVRPGYSGSEVWVREEELDRLREALAWYGEQARLARLIHSEGDAGRHALNADGGKRARAVLAALAEHERKGGK